MNNATGMTECITTENKWRASALGEDFGMETRRIGLYRLAGDSKVFSLSVSKNVNKHLYRFGLHQRGINANATSRP